MVVNPRRDIDVAAVPGDGILPVGAVQGRFEGVEVGLQVLALRGAGRLPDLDLRRFHVNQALACGGEAALTGAASVDLEQVAAGDLGRPGVLGFQFVHIDPVGRTPHPLLQHVDAVVGPGIAEGANRIGDQEQLNETGP